MSDYRPGGRPFTGSRMLLVILVFFGVIIAVNATMATLAVRNFRGVIVDSGFVASQDFNRDHARLAAQAARGWGAEASAPGARPLVALRDAEGRPLAGLDVRLVAERPADARADRALTVTEAAPGLYAAAEALAPGRWTLALVAEGAGPVFAETVELWVEPEATPGAAR